MRGEREGEGGKQQLLMMVGRLGNLRDLHFGNVEKQAWTVKREGARSNNLEKTDRRDARICGGMFGEAATGAARQGRGSHPTRRRGQRDNDLERPTTTRQASLSISTVSLLSHSYFMPYLGDGAHALEARLGTCRRASFHWGRARGSRHAGTRDGGTGVDLNRRHEVNSCTCEVVVVVSS